MKYLIVNKERSDDTLCFWKSNRTGYTESIKEAGRYSGAEAAKIVQDSMGQELMLAEQDLDHFEIRQIISFHDDNRWSEIQGLSRENLAQNTPDGSGWYWH